jgi:hypothetical protein
LRSCLKQYVISFRQQVEELLAKYKQSEIERMELEAKNKQELEAKDKEIEKQAKELLQLQKSDEAKLQQYQKQLQDLREELSDEKSSARSELIQQMEKLFVKMKNANNGLVAGSKKDLDKQRRRLNKRLKREWSKLDQYEMKLIEVEAEKRKITQDAETRLKEERTKSEVERKRRLEEVETQKKYLQEILEGHLKERENARRALDGAKRESTKWSEKVDENLDVFWKKLTKLEWFQYKLCTDQLESEDTTDEIAEIMMKIKTVNNDLEILESQNNKNCEKLREAQVELEEKGKLLESCEMKVQQSLSEMAEVRDKLVECQQRFGEELGDVVNIVSLERDADLVKIEKDREILMSKHLEHQSALEVLVNENLESSDDDDSVEIKEIKSRVVELVRSVSPGLDDESLQSQIIDKKLQIHYQQAEVGKKEDERKVLQAHEERFQELTREVQTQRESEQHVLQEKINALQEMLDNEDTKESANYYESESSSLVNAQRRMFDVDKELSHKIRERREIEAKLEHVKKQMEQQAECNQEQFREILERLQRQGKDVDRDIQDIRRMLQSEAEEYLKRLK